MADQTSDPFASSAACSSAEDDSHGEETLMIDSHSAAEDDDDLGSIVSPVTTSVPPSASVSPNTSASTASLATSNAPTIASSTTTAQVPRKRGRPRKNPLAEPSQPKKKKRSKDDDDNDDFEDKPKKKRGRKPNPKPAVKAAPLPVGAIPLPTDVVEVERILFKRSTRVQSDTGGDADTVDEFLIKFKNRSFLHCEWVSREWVEQHDLRGKHRLKYFEEKTMSDMSYSLLSEERPFNDAYTKIDRILDHSPEFADPFTGDKSDWYLVKWCGLPYENSTWESLATLIHECDHAEYHVGLMEHRTTLPHQNDPDFFTKSLPEGVRPSPASWKKMEASPEYKEGNSLRSYQLEGLNWLSYCWHNHQSCIIADEMGLGKTVQSVTFLKLLYDQGCRGPFLIVAPLSTIPHWERTVLNWTDMNAVVFHGGTSSRNTIQEYEFYFRDSHGKKVPAHEACVGAKIKDNVASVDMLKRVRHPFKFDIIITTYEMAIVGAATLRGVGTWRCVIVDEAHRLKNKQSKVGEILKTYTYEHRVLLTGTPIQNSLEELWSILNFMDPKRFPDGTEKQFLSEYDLRSAADVTRLQDLLRPLMLRRLKEDVETSIPVKEETIVEVELTTLQRAYYRAILERNFTFLRQGAKKNNMPSLINAMMELRKCCIHPYLIQGAEEKIISESQKEATHENLLDLLIQSSGKLVLLDKLLPKLKAGGHRVLIFSQMTRCLDILSDYLRYKSYSHERIDGSIRGEQRQAAIDRFSAPDSDTFIFLLCTRAGGVGINLTAADSVVIFDSDWNPMNDLQAQARVHRIGQKKSVKIYRLLTRNTYETTMFEKAGLKLGLDRAVLSRMDFDADTTNGSGGSGSTPSNMSKKEIEELLKKGAYAAIMDDADDSESKKFCDEDIDSILSRRAQVIIHDDQSKKETKQPEGSLFSKATFALDNAIQQELDIDDPNFWDKWAQKANVDTTEPAEQDVSQFIDEPRRRKRTDRFNNASSMSLAVEEEMVFSDNDAADDDVDSQTPATATTAPSSKRKRQKGVPMAWSFADRQRVERGLMAFGFGAWEKKILAFPKQSRRTIADLKAVEVRLIRHCMERVKLENIAKRSKKGSVTSDDLSGATMLAEDRRLLEDCEAALRTVRWELPGLNELDLAVTQVPPQPKLEKDPEWGEYPYPGASRKAFYEYRTFLDECPSNYRDHLVKKARNILLRVQFLYVLRHLCFRIDPHVVGADESDIASSANMDEEDDESDGPMDIQRVEAYHKAFITARDRFSFTVSYASTLGKCFQPNVNNDELPAAWAKPVSWWTEDDDRDVLVGIVKWGYQAYHKIRVDPDLKFAVNKYIVLAADAGEEEYEDTGTPAPELSGQ